MGRAAALLTRGQADRSALRAGNLPRTLAVMGLEESSVEDLGNSCDECGATLTEEEAAAVLESGGPNLCTVCSAEVADGDGDLDEQ